ncbi:MAG: hypothetical protein CMI12_15365 [Oceanospirillum sp.]|nr:hypothetical protein [Oceanospirillum sp.]
MATRKAVTTDRGLKALKPEEKKYTCAVKASRMAKGGLLVQVTPKGAKTFYSRLRLSEKQIDVRLGVVNELSLAEAVQAHNEAVGMVSQGIDPRIAKAETKAKREAESTMDALVERWLEHLESVGDLKPRTIQDHRWRWNSYLKKHLGKLKANDIERGQIALALDKIRKQTKEQARKCLTTVNLALDYGLTRQIVTENPARLLRPKDFGATPNAPRDRWLSIAELRQLWRYLDSDQHNISFTMVTAIKLLIFTGARRSEVIQAQWSEFDLDNGVWLLPAERSKNKQPHTFYLAAEAIELVKALLPETGHSQHVFESPSLKGQPITPPAVSRAINRIWKALDCDPLTVHDLRRTCSSHWVDTLGADSRLGELMLNHLPADKLVRTYQQGKQPERQRDTWEQWAEVIATRVMRDAENVTNLNARSA